MDTEPNNTDTPSPTPATTSEQGRTFEQELKARRQLKRRERNNKRRKWRRRFLSHLAKSGHVRNSARYAGVSEGYAHNYRRKTPRFALLWQKALERWEQSLADELEAEAIRRAKDGVDKPIYQGGKLVGYERRYSDTLLIKALAAYRPERWDRGGKDGTTVTVGVQVNADGEPRESLVVTPEDIANARALLEQMAADQRALPRVADGEVIEGE